MLPCMGMPKKMYIFRCPQPEFEEIERICAENGTDHSRVVNAALLMFTDCMAEEGILEPQQLPPCVLEEAQPVPVGRE